MTIVFGICFLMRGLIASNQPSSGSMPVLGSTPSQEPTKAAPVIGKNMARYHMGTILEKFDPETRFYLPDRSAVAWLDEDDTTVYEIPPGKQWYLMTLDRPTLIQNFSMAAESLKGKVSLYASDQKAVPGSKNWTPLFKGVPAQDLKEKEYQKPLYSFTRYVLLEIDLSQSAIVSSLYLFTDSDPSSYRLTKRAEPSRFTDKAGPFYKDTKGQVNFAGKYARNSGGVEDDNFAKMVDESPETNGSLDQKPMVIDLKEVREMERFSIFAEKKKGRMTILLEPDRSASGPLPRVYIPEAVRFLMGMGWQKSSGLFVQATGGEIKSSNAISRTIVLDGSSDRISIQVPATPSQFLTMTWVSGESPASSLQIKNFSAMGDVSLNEFQVSRSVGNFEGSGPLPVGDPAAAKGNNLNNSSKETNGTTVLGNSAVQTEDPLRLPPITPVSN